MLSIKNEILFFKKYLHKLNERHLYKYKIKSTIGIIRSAKYKKMTEWTPIAPNYEELQTELRIVMRNWVKLILSCRI